MELPSQEIIDAGTRLGRIGDHPLDTSPSPTSTEGGVCAAWLLRKKETWVRKTKGRKGRGWVIRCFGLRNTTGVVCSSTAPLLAAARKSNAGLRCMSFYAYAIQRVALSGE